MSFFVVVLTFDRIYGHNRDSGEVEKSRIIRLFSNV